ncbi:hypothetical protein, partial [Leptospira borgpetersenii]
VQVFVCKGWILVQRTDELASLVLDRGQKETGELLHHGFRMQFAFRGQKETGELLHHGFRMQFAFRGQKETGELLHRGFRMQFAEIKKRTAFLRK